MTTKKRQPSKKSTAQKAKQEVPVVPPPAANEEENPSFFIVEVYSGKTVRKLGIVDPNEAQEVSTKIIKEGVYSEPISQEDGAKGIQLWPVDTVRVVGPYKQQQAEEKQDDK